MRRSPSLACVAAALLAAVAVSGCGGSEPAEPPPGSPPPVQEVNPDARVVTLHPVGNEMRFDPEEITVEAGETIRVIFENSATSPGMSHNFVLLGDAAARGRVGRAALTAPAPDHVPQDPAILAHTGMARPGETVQVELDVPPPGDYVFVCTFPGHYARMHGVLHAIE